MGKESRVRFAPVAPIYTIYADPILVNEAGYCKRDNEFVIPRYNYFEQDYALSFTSHRFVKD